MSHIRSTLPFIHVRTQGNRTPTGPRSSTAARRAVHYYAYGREVSQQQAQTHGRLRGQWLGSDGRVQTHAEVLAWVQQEALRHRYTFQGLLSVPEAELAATAFGRALQAAGQPAEWCLMAHHDTRHAHAHVLWFGDRRPDKAAFLAWQRAVRAELQRLLAEQAQGHAAQQVQGLAQSVDEQVGQQAELEPDPADSRRQGIGYGW